MGVIGATRPKGPGSTAGPLGLPLCGGWEGRAAEEAESCFLSKEEQSDASFWFPLLVKFLLAQEAENACLFFNNNKKQKQ